MSEQIVTPETLKEIERAVSEYRAPGDFGDQAIEIEVRFGSHYVTERGYGFISGVSGRTFARIRNESMSLTKDYTFSYTKDEYFDKNSEDRYTTVMDTTGKPQQTYHMKKTRLQPFDFPKYFFRIGLSREDQDDQPRPKGEAATVREKKRWSFPSHGGEFRLDMTEVTMYIPPKYRDATTEYEIELEIIRNKVQNLRVLNLYLNSLLRKIFGTIHLYTADEKNQVIDRINDALGSVTRTPGLIDIAPLTQVRNLKFHDMVYGGLTPKTDKSVRYTATIKADGIRRLLVLDQSGVYLAYPPTDLNKILDETYGQKLGQWHGSIFEGELIPLERVSEDAPEEYRSAKIRLHLYDTVSFRNSRAVRNQSHLKRLEYVDRILPIFSKLKNSGYLFERKLFTPFQTTDEFYQSVNNLLIGTYPFLTDGLIFTPDNYMYDSESTTRVPDLAQNPDITKWKAKITIDFYVSHVVDPEGNYVELLVVNRKALVQFVGSSTHPFNPRTDIEMNDMVRLAPNGTVIEFEWTESPQKGTSATVKKFRAIQVRYDKVSPNSLRVALDDWKDIHDPISEKAMLGREFRLVFKYHNREKKVLYDYVGSALPKLIGPPFTSRTILEIGVGKGGDIAKWKSAGFTHVIAVEPDEINRREFISRLEVENSKEPDPSKRLRVKLVPTVGQDVTTILQAVQEFAPKKKVDVISYMLSLSFLFKDAQSINSIRKLAQDTLDVGGYFIAFTVDGRKVLELFQRPGYYSDVIGARRASFQLITMELRQPTPQESSHHIFINIPNSIVTNQVEYLTNIPEIDTMLSQIGIVKVRETHATAEKFMTQEELIFSYLFTSLIYRRN